MTHDASIGLGLILFAAIPAIVTAGTLMTGQVSFGQAYRIVYNRAANPIIFWGYTSLFGISAIGLVGYGLVLLVKASFAGA